MQLGQHLAFGRGDLAVDALDRGQVGGIVQQLAPGHLLHQEGGGHRGVALGIHRCAAKFAQVGAARQRLLQALVGLVDAHRPLHGQALRGGAFGGEAIRVDLALQLAPAGVDGGTVLRKALRQHEEGEVVVVDLHSGLP